MKIKFLNLFVAFSLSASALWAQSKIEFEKTSHQFGIIKEDGGLAEIEFKFKNTGNQPLKLTNVQASCGCTTPSWTKDDIMPNQTGFVKAAYDPLNRPGKFDKSITVYTNGEPNTLLLQIAGEVTARQKSYTDFYPIESGNLRFDNTHIGFADVNHDGSDTSSVVVYNQGTKPINLLLQKTVLPAHVTVQAAKTILQPTETTRLMFKFDAIKKSDWGYVFDNFTLTTDDDKEPNKQLYLSADIKENFAYRKNRTTSPKVSFDRKGHDFGNVAQNTVNTTTFTIRNEGTEDLILRKVKATCGCTATNPQKEVLKPNESTTVDVTYSSGQQSGKQNKYVTVVTNDPKEPVVQLSLEADVSAEAPKPEITPQPQVAENSAVDLTNNSLVKATPNPVLPITPETPTVTTTVIKNTVPVPTVENTVKYQVGDKVYFENSVKGKKMLITGFVEELNGEKIKIRVADLEGKKNTDWDGIKIAPNSIIWDNFARWSLTKPQR